MSLIDIFLVILILSASALCIYAIIYLKNLTAQLETIRKDVHELVEKTSPVLQNLNDITRKANRVVSDVENYWEDLDNSIKNLRERISNLTSLKRFTDADNPISELIKNIRAIAKGIHVFWQAIQRK